jgi:Na+-transporting NADH:ubiquinone oxidoreductase subunit B
LVPFEAYRILPVCLSAALFTAMGVAVWRREGMKIDASLLFITLLYSLLVPPDMPSWMIAAGIFAAVFAGREIFGGLGTSFLNPALVGSAFLQLSFPEMFSSASFFSTDSLPAHWITFAALFLGGLVLLSSRVVNARVPVTYFLTALLLEKMLPSAMPEISIRRYLFAGLFLMADSENLSLFGSGRSLAAALAALLTPVLKMVSAVPVPEVFAVLSINLLSPWLDQWLRTK